METEVKKTNNKRLRSRISYRKKKLEKPNVDVVGVTADMERLKIELETGVRELAEMISALIPIDDEIENLHVTKWELYRKVSAFQKNRRNTESGMDTAIERILQKKWGCNPSLSWGVIDRCRMQDFISKRSKNNG